MVYLEGFPKYRIQILTEWLTVEGIASAGSARPAVLVPAIASPAFAVMSLSCLQAPQQLNYSEPVADFVSTSAAAPSVHSNNVIEHVACLFEHSQVGVGEANKNARRSYKASPRKSKHRFQRRVNKVDKLKAEYLKRPKLSTDRRLFLLAILRQKAARPSHKPPWPMRPPDPFPSQCPVSLYPSSAPPALSLDQSGIIIYPTKVESNERDVISRRSLPVALVSKGTFDLQS